MIVFLYGPDSYRRLARKNFYAGQFEKKYGIPARQIDLAAEDGLVRLEEAAKGQSLFEARQLLILENAFAPEPKKLLPLLEFFKNSKESNLLLTEDKKPVKALEALLKKPVIAEELPILKDAAWAKFARDEAKKAGAKIAPEALAFLAEAYAGDSWGLVTELRKSAGASEPLTPADLEGMGVERPRDYWFLVNALRNPRPAARLSALEAMLSAGEPAAKIFNILAALWSQRAADFAAYDRAVKFGRMDYDEALTDLALS